MSEDHPFGGWTTTWVVLNTLATLLGSLTGSAALILYVLDKTR